MRACAQDQRLEGGAEHPLGRGHPLGDRERRGDRPVLRHQLADHHQDERGQHGAQQQGDALGGAPRQAEAAQRPGQQAADRRLREHADDQAGHGDAELGAGQLEGETADRLQGTVRTPLAVGHGRTGIGEFESALRSDGGVSRRVTIPAAGGCDAAITELEAAGDATGWQLWPAACIDGLELDSAIDPAGPGYSGAAIASAGH